uniref:Putative ovule protein n=1 Tax=Solanum chacoense TaxID=4108 RepID=A0A0V0GRH5_SOLCH
MEIQNDMDVQVYFNSDSFSKYPLCVTCVDRAMDAIEYQICDQVTRQEIIRSNAPGHNKKTCPKFANQN